MSSPAPVPPADYPLWVSRCPEMLPALRRYATEFEFDLSSWDDARVMGVFLAAQAPHPAGPEMRLTGSTVAGFVDALRAIVEAV